MPGSLFGCLFLLNQFLPSDSLTYLRSLYFWLLETHGSRYEKTHPIILGFKIDQLWPTILLLECLKLNTLWSRNQKKHPKSFRPKNYTIMNIIYVFLSNVICHTFVWVSFNNWLDQILSTFDYHLPPSSGQLWTFCILPTLLQVTKYEHHTNYLLISSCPHSIWMTPW